MGAGFGVCQGVVVIAQVKAAIGGDSVKFVVWKLLEQAFSSPTGTVELVVGVIHLVTTEHGFKATLVKRLVVGDQWQALDKRFNLRPHFREHRRIVSVTVTESVDALAPIIIVVGLGLDKGIEGVYNLTIPNNNYTDCANAGAFGIGGLKVYGCKVLHLYLNFRLSTLKRLTVIQLIHFAGNISNDIAQGKGFQYLNIVALGEQFHSEVKLWAQVICEHTIVGVPDDFMLGVVQR